MDFRKLLGPYQKMPSSVYAVFFARMVNSMGNFVMPFLTILLTDYLRLTKLDAGKFVMMAALSFGMGSIVGGKFCDRMGRKMIIIITHGLAALLLIPCAFMGRSLHIPWFFIVSAFFRGADEPAYLAMIGDLTNHNNRKAVFSFLYLGSNIGFALGPMIAGFLYRSHLPWIFIGDAMTSLISIFLVGIYVKETIPKHHHSVDNFENMRHYEKPVKGGLFAALIKRPVLILFLTIMIVYSFVYAQHVFSLPIQVDEFFPENGPKFFGILMTVNALTIVFFTPIVTGFTMKLKPITMIFLGGIQFAIGFGMLYFINTLHLIIISTILWSVGEVFVTTNSGVYFTDNTPISHRGRFNAVFQIITGSGFALAPILTGAFIDARGIKMVWILCIVLALSASTLMICLRLYEKYCLKKNIIDKGDV